MDFWLMWRNLWKGKGRWWRNEKKYLKKVRKKEERKNQRETGRGGGESFRTVACLWPIEDGRHADRAVLISHKEKNEKKKKKEEGLVQYIQTLSENTKSSVLFGSQQGEFFKTTVCVHKECLRSPILFNLFLEKISQKTLHNLCTSLSIGGRPISNLRFADYISPVGRQQWWT